MAGPRTARRTTSARAFEASAASCPIIDVSDPYNAKWLLNWTFTGDGRPHDLSTNQDGTRMYSGQPGNFGVAPTNSSFGPDGLVILDMSDIQFRLPNPQIRIVSRLFWNDQGQAEQMLPFFSHGRSYLISTDESGGQAGVGGLAAACARGASPYGYSNVIDITDETNPRIVSKIMLEVHDPANCTKFLSEPPEVGGGNLDYSTERCALDRPKNPTMAACGSRGTGTRVYDIRDPLHPAEIAYWKGPAPRTAFLPGSGSWSPTVDRTVEKQAGLARFVKVPAANGKGHELNLWIVGDAGGFQVLRFTDEFLQTKPGKAIHAEALRDDRTSKLVVRQLASQATQCEIFVAKLPSARNVLALRSRSKSHFFGSLGNEAHIRSPPGSRRRRFRAIARFCSVTSRER